MPVFNRKKNYLAVTYCVDATDYPTAEQVDEALNSKQNELVSGVDIKTVNGDSILGSGNLVVTGSGAEWGDITGTLSDQTDLQTALNAKQATLVSGTSIKTVNSTSLLGSGDVAVQPTLVSGTNIKTVNGTSLLGSGDVAITSVSGNAGTATALQTARNIGGVSFDGTASIVPQTIESANEATDTTCFPLFITASGTQQLQPKNNTGLTYNSNTNNLGATTFTGNLTGNVTGNTSGSSGSCTGNALTATTLQNARNINGVSFNGSGDITVPAAAGTLTGATLASGVTASSLTSFGNSPTLVTPLLGTPTSGVLTNCTGTASGLTAGNATTLATARNINGVSFNGSADIVAGLYGRVTGSNATRTAQTLADIAGLSVACVANGVYDFQACLSVASSSTAGNGYGVQFSTAGATVEAQIQGTLNATASMGRRLNALNTASSGFVAVAADGAIWIEGILFVGANAGNLTIQHSKITSGTATVYIGSYLRAIRIA